MVTTVLAVDDNAVTLRMLRAVLESDGYHVLTAADGAAALAAARTTRPDLCVIDLILPDLDGVELARRLRAEAGLAGVSMIALSGLVGRADRPEVAEFDAWLIKPVEADQLLDVLRAHLPGPAAASASAPAAPSLLVVDDDPVQAKLSRLHLQRLGFDVVVAHTGAEALALARARPPAAVVSDVLMPEMDGFELCLAIRRDPALAHIPVLLTSAHYRERADHELAERVGANALVVRGPELAQVASAIADLVRAPPPAARPSAKNGELIRAAHHHAVARRLERSIAANVALSHRCATLGAQLQLISRVAEALTRATRVDHALDEVLEACFDAAGVSRGALYLASDDGPLELVTAVGYSADERDALRSFFGHPEVLERVVGVSEVLTFPESADDAAGAAAAAAAVLAGASAASVHLVPLTHDGRLRGALFLASAAKDLGDEGLVSFARAIGGQIVKSIALSRAFDRIAASEARYRTLMDHASCGVVALRSPDARIVDANRMAERLFGAPTEALTGRALVEFLAESDRAPVAAWLAGDEVDSWREVSVVRHDGARARAELSWSRIVARDEELVLVIANDVTARRRAQEMAALTERLTTMGTLAAGVAHEINNPAAYVIANLDVLRDKLDAVEPRVATLREALAAEPSAARVEMLLRGLEDGALLAVLDEARQIAAETLHGAQRIRAIAGGMKDLAGHREVDVTRIDLGALLDGALELCAHEVRSRARVVRSHAPEVPPVLGSAGRLAQVFVNLIVNAAQAIDEGSAADHVIRVTTALDGDRARVDVEDTGSGIPADVLPRIFDPFFTTKPAGVGTGLGLAITQEIVHSHGGEVRVTSERGRGTRVSVWLPVAPPDVGADVGADVASPAPSPGPSGLPGNDRSEPAETGRRLRILLVDDEVFLLRALKRLLARHFDIETAEGGREAIRLLESAPADRFDVLFSDLSMPEVSGRDLYRWLVEHRPGLAARTVFMTGGAFSSGTREFLAEVSNPRIGKPFTAETAAAVIANLTALRDPAAAD